MSQYHEDVQTLWEQAADSQEKAAQELEWLRIAHAHKEISFNLAVRKVVLDYFNGDPITLQDFENAYAIESIPGRQTLRQMIQCPQTVTDRNQKLKAMDHDELRREAHSEQAVKNANAANPVVQQVPLGTPVLPLFVTRKWIKQASKETIAKLRVQWTKDHRQGPTFNEAIQWRWAGNDELETRRLSGGLLGE